MIYSIVYSKSARKQLLKMERIDQERIIAALERIRVRPGSFVKKLVGVPGYRLRVGEYRVIMDIDNGKLLILVINIGHRKKIYEK